MAVLASCLTRPYYLTRTRIGTAGTCQIASSECGCIHRCLVSALERVESTFVGGPRKLCCAQSLKAQKTIYDSAFK